MGREFALLGDPVAHSLSPRIHEAVFAHWGADASYSTKRVTPDGLAAALRECAGSGGGNVTVPHKRAAVELVDEPTRAVTATGACNCFWGTPGGAIAGDNTDVGGFVAAIRDFGVTIDGSGVLLLGGGGAARAVVYALHQLSVGRIEIWNRTPARAAEIATESGGGVTVLERLPREGDYDLVINATTRGLEAHDPLPLDLTDGVASAAFDLVYAEGGTGWVRHASELGIPASDGLGMLVHQAALSLSRWFPDREPPLDVMFDAVGS